ncbi:hypothetical protein COCON_G00053200 [Conger conger]|uniref:THD domain-containing protein n=1 Tax=Conger conger TaxID=82655 RepID=A0A9Q1DVX9_CONCO|nr:CD40 ligand [Conger conger]KAJ8282801.1 hypothetical protein COCON_G00053200 [Conger conger]
MINTYHTSLPPPPIPPRHGVPQPAPGRTNLPVWLFLVILLLQMVLTFGGFVYLFRKNALMQNEFLNKNIDDIVVLRRLRECNDESLDSNSLLDCKQVLQEFMAVMSKISQTATGEKGAMLSGWVPFHDSLAVAHMVAQPPLSKILKWNSNLSLLKRVTYLSTAGALQIIEPGNYYIYSQVTFSKMHPKAPLAQSIVSSHSSGGQTEEKVLLRAFATLKSQNTQFTSFQGGVFRLKKDEQLYLNVTDENTISLEKSSTTFGLFML